jgi:Lon protease-like protein
MSFELPIFPLNVVLFPGMPLPLHIFEPRYRLMMSRVLEGDRTFGVALIAEGTEGMPGTYPAPVGCTAEIVENSLLPDGRINLQSEGRRRFRILSLREEDDYLIATVEWLEEEMPAESEVEQARDVAQSVSRALRRYLAMVAPGSQAAIEELEMPQDPEELSHWVAMLLAVPNAQKQLLLETSSTLERLQLELQLLNRAHIVQEAFTRRNRLAESETGGEATDEDTSFVWLN